MTHLCVIMTLSFSHGVEYRREDPTFNIAMSIYYLLFWRSNSEYCGVALWNGWYYDVCVESPLLNLC